ncbi:hypothetical protein I3843_06G050000 [Carya illinoinensis]|nr:hypothetical protein I3843_06G050000 [Carya illinoinensis]
MAENGHKDRDEKHLLLLQDHEEKHFMSSEIVRDIILGVSDGLTVPFALAAGLSGADVPSSIILIAGIAEVAAGAISMGLGGYLAAKSEADHYSRELKREQEEIIAVPDIVLFSTKLSFRTCALFIQYCVHYFSFGKILVLLRISYVRVRNPQAWLDFMMKFELGLEKPQSALIIAMLYVMGGSVPLIPYMLIPAATGRLFLALLFFGLVKGYFMGNQTFKSAFQTVLIGAIASVAAYSIAKVFQ